MIVAEILYRPRVPANVVAETMSYLTFYGNDKLAKELKELAKELEEFNVEICNEETQWLNYIKNVHLNMIKQYLTTINQIKTNKLYFLNKNLRAKVKEVQRRVLVLEQRNVEIEEKIDLVEAKKVKPLHTLCAEQQGLVLALGFKEGNRIEKGTDTNIYYKPTCTGEQILKNANVVLHTLNQEKEQKIKQIKFFYGKYVVGLKTENFTKSFNEIMSLDNTLTKE